MYSKEFLMIATITFFITSVFYSLIYFVVSKFKGYSFSKEKIFITLLFCGVIGTISITYLGSSIRFLMMFPAIVFVIQEIRRNKETEDQLNQ